MPGFQTSNSRVKMNCGLSFLRLLPGVFLKPTAGRGLSRTKNIFNHSSVASSDPEFAKGKACSKGTVRPSVNSKKAALQRLVSRVFGFSPNARVPKFERWLSPVFLPKQQAAEDGTCRFNAACCFVVWYFGGTISLPVVEETIQSWYAGVVYLV